MPTDSRYAYVSRVASIQAGLSMDSVAMQVSRLCASGLQDIVTTAQKATRKARRDADRRQHLKTSEPPAKPIPPDVDMADPQADNQPPAKPFDQIEEW